MEFFQKFPTVTQETENLTVRVVDLLCYFPTPIDEFDPLRLLQQSTSDLARVSNRVYGDSSNYWSIAVANQEVNPWEVFPPSPSEIAADLADDYSLILVDSTVALTPEAYQFAFPGDIVGYYSTGVGYTGGITGMNPDGDYAVVKEFNSDTSVITVVHPINTGAVSKFSPSDPATTFYILRQTDDGYEIVLNSLGSPSFSATQKTDALSQVVNNVYLDTGGYVSSSIPVDSIPIKDLNAYPDLVPTLGEPVPFATTTLQSAVNVASAALADMVHLQSTDVTTYYSTLRT